MTNDERKITISYIQAELEKLNKQRQSWLKLSSVVVIVSMCLIFGWNAIENLHSALVWWFIGSSMIILSINWWYWTMSFVRRGLFHQLAMFEILSDIVDEVKMVKEDVIAITPKKRLTKPK